MKKFVEYYKMGISLFPFSTKEVESLVEKPNNIPEGTFRFRYIEKDDLGNIKPISPYYYIGEEILAEIFKKKYPQVNDINFDVHPKILKTEANSFYPLMADEEVRYASA